MSLIDIAQEKWFKKTTAARSKWLEMVKKSESLDAFVKGVASFLGISEAEVRASIPVANWAEFQRNADKYVDKLISNVRKSYELKKWANNYKMAFTAKR